MNPPDVLVLADTGECWDPEGGQWLCRRVHEVTGSEWAANAADWFLSRPLSLLGLLLLAVVLRWLLHRVIKRLTRRAIEGDMPAILQRSVAREIFESGAMAERRRQRAEALSSLLTSITTGVIFVVVVIMAIDILGYNIAPVLASAGVLGVALGFGAQTLVKDVLSGIFMILEDQCGVGDFIDAGEASGTVEAVGLRVIQLRGLDGTLWFVRNGEILRIGNMSQDWARAVLDVGVGYSHDLRRVRDVLMDEAQRFCADPAFRASILEEPEVWGVERMDPDAIVVRLVVKTAPMEQWEVGRELRERIKARFDREGIEIPLPQRVVWHRDQPGAVAPAPSAAGSTTADPAPTGRGSRQPDGEA